LVIRLSLILFIGRENREIIVVTMGGDGMLGCFLDDITKDEFIAQNMQKLTFVPLPYGTGNDLSRSIGWGFKQGPWGQDLETLTSALIAAPKD
jgi:diacylglycerol kinase family enzyme